MNDVNTHNHAAVKRLTTISVSWSLGDRKLHLVPVGLSLQATLFSASIVLGSPVEVYTYGFVYVWIALASASAIPFLVWIFIPVFRRTKAISAYEVRTIIFRVS